MTSWQFCALGASIALAPHCTEQTAMAAAGLWIAAMFIMKDKR